MSARTWREAYDEYYAKFLEQGVPINDAREWAREEADEEMTS